MTEYDLIKITSICYNDEFFPFPFLTSCISFEKSFCFYIFALSFHGLKRFFDDYAYIVMMACIHFRIYHDKSIIRGAECSDRHHPCFLMSCLQPQVSVNNLSNGLINTKL